MRRTPSAFHKVPRLHLQIKSSPRLVDGERAEQIEARSGEGRGARADSIVCARATVRICIGRICLLGRARPTFALLSRMRFCSFASRKLAVNLAKRGGASSGKPERSGKPDGSALAMIFFSIVRCPRLWPLPRN
jgi:hypothetical protein